MACLRIGTLMIGGSKSEMMGIRRGRRWNILPPSLSLLDSDSIKRNIRGAIIVSECNPKEKVVPQPDFLWKERGDWLVGYDV